MALGQTLKLEDALLADHTLDIRPAPLRRKDRCLERSLERSLDRTLDLRSTPPRPSERRVWSRNNSREKLESLPDRPPLEWTHAPNTRVEQDPSGFRYQVSVPSTAGARFHKPHLKQTFRLEPCGHGRPPPLPVPGGSKVEQIVVKESDLLRFGHDLRRLREVQVQPHAQGQGETPPPANKFELSFKSAFAQRCRAGADVRDPWEGLQNPEFSREHSESDLVLNQVFGRREAGLSNCGRTELLGFWNSNMFRDMQGLRGLGGSPSFVFPCSASKLSRWEFGMFGCFRCLQDFLEIQAH